MSDKQLVERLRNRIAPQSCDQCEKDSATYIQCGRGDCAWEADLFMEAAAALESQEQATTFGCALAMRVMQSDLYRLLDDKERGECDELIARWHDSIKTGTSAGTENP